MLPPQLKVAARQRTIRNPTGLRPSSITFSQSRSFWGGRRTRDWSSTLDPTYYHNNRYHTLKTRAKLIANVKRRSKLHWDDGVKPFFSSKHARWASHWGQRPPGGIYRFKSEDPKREERQDDADRKNGLELSPREKAWKDQMERVRKRIEQDPYEAVFGKRFEPFWGPLVPSWMREEMGLKSGKDASKVVETMSSAQLRSEPKDSSDSTKVPSQPKSATVDDAQPIADAKNSNSNSYAFASTTSYDSWTNKACRTEWDSNTNRLRKLEYDPVSNRMVPADAAGEAKPMPSVTDAPASIGKRDAASIPVRPLRGATSSASSTSSANKSLTKSSSVTAQPSASTKPNRPSALAKLPERDLDLLTSDSVRASMGKLKPTAATSSSPQEKARLERAYETNNQTRDSLDASHSGKQAVLQTKRMWDNAELVWQYEHEIRALSAKHAKHKLLPASYESGTGRRERQRIEDRIEELRAQIIRLESNSSLAKDNMDLVKTQEFYYNEKARKRENATDPMSQTPRLETSIARKLTEQPKAAKAESKGRPLELASERMQSKSARKILEDPDDSAAHESTEPIELESSVPKEWQRQADILQGERVERTSGKILRPLTRWADDMEKHKAVFELRRAEMQAQDAIRMADTKAKADKISAKLQAEVSALKTAYMHHDTHHTHDPRPASTSQTVPQKGQTSGSQQELKDLRGEGDWCPNITKYADSSKWYKQPATLPQTSKTEVEKAARKAGDQQLVRDVREIYEKRYGAIEIGHRQSADVLPVQATVQPAMSESICPGGMQEPEQAYKQLEDPEKYKFKQENLAAIIKARDEEAVRQRHVMQPETESRQWQVTAEDLDEHGYGAPKSEPVVEGLQEHSYDGGVPGTTQTKRQPAKTLATSVSACPGGMQEPEQAYKDLEKPATYKFKKDNLAAIIAANDSEAVKSRHIMHPEAESRTWEVPAESLEEHGYGGAPSRPVEENMQEHSYSSSRKPATKTKRDKSYQFKDDQLANIIAAKDKEAVKNRHIMQPEAESRQWEVKVEDLEEHGYGAASAKPEIEGLHEHSYSSNVQDTKLVDDKSLKLIPTELGKTATAARKANAETTNTNKPSAVTYDSGNDIITSATATSNFTPSENPISIPQALSQLYQPARFVPHFASLQKEGYQVIYGTKDLLVFKLVKTAVLATEVVKPADPDNASPSPGTAAVRDHARINPVDGTGSSRRNVEPSTGNFASPTGFVNHDPVFTEEKSADSATAPETKASKTSTGGQQTDDFETAYVRHFPRVKREEPVFSGSSRKWNSRHNRHQSRSEARRSRSRKRVVKYILAVAAGTAVLTYAVGVAAEGARKDRQARGIGKKVMAGENWEDIFPAAKGGR